MRRIGIHLSYWQTAWTADLLPLIDKAHAAGFDLAEFPLLFPTDLDYPALRTRLDHLNMAGHPTPTQRTPYELRPLASILAGPQNCEEEKICKPLP